MYLHSIRFSSNVCTVEAFFVAPSAPPRTCLFPPASILTAPTITMPRVRCSPSIWIATRSRPDMSEALHSSNAFCVSALKCRETLDLARPRGLSGTPLPRRRNPLGALCMETPRRAIPIHLRMSLPLDSHVRVGRRTSTRVRLSRTRGRQISTLPPWYQGGSGRPAHRWQALLAVLLWRAPARASAFSSSISITISSPFARQSFSS